MPAQRRDRFKYVSGTDTNVTITGLWSGYYADYIRLPDDSTGNGVTVGSGNFLQSTNKVNSKPHAIHIGFYTANNHSHNMITWPDTISSLIRLKSNHIHKHMT